MTGGVPQVAPIGGRGEHPVRCGVASVPLHVLGVSCFLLMHVPLGLLISQMPILGKLHALTILVVGLVWAASGVPLNRLASLAAYIAGAEVLWRMTRTPIFWEFGKYATIAVLLVAIQRTRPLRASRFPVLFFALLVPSALLTLSKTDLVYCRHELSFYLSGPLAMSVCAAFFCRVRLTPASLQRIAVAYLGPLAGIVAIVVFKLSTASVVSFGHSSSKLSSGGFGPNQVSCVLGFGTLMAFLLVVFVLRPDQRGLRLLMLCTALWLAAQSALTFSRSGLYLAGGSAFFAALVGLRDARTRMTLLATAGLFSVLAICVIVPQLDSFTTGRFSERFGDTNVTGRDILLLGDLQLWMKHPLLGVGPGMGLVERRVFHEVAHAHTELTRLVAEHGILGLGAIVLLGTSAGQAVRRAKSLRWKALVVGMIAFVVLYMLSNAMRLVLPSFTFGLIFSSFENE